MSTQRNKKQFPNSQTRNPDHHHISPPNSSKQTNNTLNPIPKTLKRTKAHPQILHTTNAEPTPNPEYLKKK
jgi:hypothetical protein